MAVYTHGRHSSCNWGSTARASAATAAAMKSAACSNARPTSDGALDLPPQRCRPVLAVCPLLHQPRLDAWVAGARLIHLHHPTPGDRLRRFASGICAQRRFEVAEEIGSGLPGAREIVFV